MNRGLLVVCASVAVLMWATTLQGAEAERYQLPVETADGAVFTQGGGIAQATVFILGSYALHAASYDEGDQAVATAVCETTAQVSSEGRARAAFQLVHTTGAQGIEWWGQLCCNAVATPYVITPAGERLEGAATRLEGIPLGQAVTHILQALDTLDGLRWVPEKAWEAAATLAEAPEDELGQAFAELLQALEQELALVLLHNALSQLGYLRLQPVELAFTAEEEGTYVLGLELETWSTPQWPGSNLAWSLGELEWVELEIGVP